MKKTQIEQFSKLINAKIGSPEALKLRDEMLKWDASKLIDLLFRLAVIEDILYEEILKTRGESVEEPQPSIPINKVAKKKKKR